MFFHNAQTFAVSSPRFVVLTPSSQSGFFFFFWEGGWWDCTAPAVPISLLVTSHWLSCNDGCLLQRWAYPLPPQPLCTKLFSCKDYPEADRNPISQQSSSGLVSQSCWLTVNVPHWALPQIHSESTLSFLSVSVVLWCNKLMAIV